MAQDANHLAPTISTHVLDTERGMPAAGVHVTLYRLAEHGKPLRLTQALTDADGRVRDLLERPLTAGDYRLEFRLANGTGADGGLDAGDGPGADGGPDAGEGSDAAPFFRRITLDLRVTDVGRGYHIPLLMAPYSMTTYRGS